MTALGYLGNVDSVEAARRYSPYFIYGPRVRRLGRIGRLGVNGRRSAAKIAAPYHSRLRGPVKAQPRSVRPLPLLLRRFAVLLDEP